ncbi:dTDP-4-dehydro-6-deoxyglucose aminotransferase [Luteibacter rhizovicinus DSM 16549]|uniref:dTDP-4-dehydro-6-deoxyglucose aminotransferase n=1 Tax=Luteibacter rhizovicinus DSM 16549 TaxID=1440763 RepID=A0A0G9HFJ4_9GAMM|nr:DegT/DnrJ/EryC1/StrS family aminotransferase [Luteibacter rhizovicinus]APG04725.1 dTDP-4-dehydro-6-deoxyglucose aminotransferase [Luteibacter rhizovicinus DSM 16549]KLD68216.1 dTDP-4-dehydro-6-deoxyglucose aminotransferase [Luteibacter rhizovicinus DSM 16549]KLD78842.1 dTDP-4-dehydro-6-deoxyglucose aminotransferase [Xanthomonas hyacinthi DSM 19077]
MSIDTTFPLAINGAPPRFREPVHVGRPNTGDRSVFLAHMEAMFDRNWLTNNGPLVQEFERRIAEDLGVRHCVAICNGTVALEIAIRALGLTGEVIVPSWTFIATAHALAWQGLTPVFADVDPVTQNLSPASVRAAITPRTTGIMAVHTWGRPADVEGLSAIADEFGLQLMFDAAHGYRCTHNGKRIGGFGACEVLSFHATKVFNTLEGGAIVTNDDALAERMRLMRNFGFAGYDNVIHPGTNGKMIEASAAMGLTNLASLDGFVAANRERYEIYRERLSGVPGVTMVEYDDAEENNFHYIVASIDAPARLSRDNLIDVLHAENILARKYFWPGCHQMKPYASLPLRVPLPATERIAEHNVVLPSGPSLSLDDVHAICDVIAYSCSRGIG